MRTSAVLSLSVALLSVASIERHAAADEEPKKSLRRPRQPEPKVEIVDLGGGTEPQAFALGVHVGGAYLYNHPSEGQGAGHVALVADFGLGAGGARIPWTLEGWIGFAMPYGVLFEKGGYPRSFTELGVRAVHRFERGLLENRWVSIGVGAVWTSRRPTSGFFHPSSACRLDAEQAAELGLDCSDQGRISPGALLDLGAAIYEDTSRRARWGVAIRAPIQLSHAPGFALMAVLYAQIGTAI